MRDILVEAKDYAVNGGALVFPRQRGDRMLSENTFRKLYQTTTYDIDVHGFMVGVSHLIARPDRLGSRSGRSRTVSSVD